MLEHTVNSQTKDKQVYFQTQQTSTMSKKQPDFLLTFYWSTDIVLLFILRVFRHSQLQKESSFFQGSLVMKKKQTHKYDNCCYLVDSSQNWKCSEKEKCFTGT